MKWIDEILVGLVESVSNNVYEILNELNIYYFAVDPDNSVLKGNLAVYNRIGGFECIYYSNDIVNKEYVLAHEIGHAVLHTEESEIFYNPLLNKSKMEREADYFATKLLYNDYKIEDGIETTQQLANKLGIKEDFIKFIIEK
ncbi:ImmA/IrrE family metallo-endopeptidase [Helcococcus ovis]|uniref:ImmA/IrrE family metallo-endopeptidase n=1 Tax=Helcococcus ovis TaxID=72026 RepID=UPI0038B73469